MSESTKWHATTPSRTIERAPRRRRPARRLVRRGDVRTHELDTEALVFDPVSADTHHLNETAYWIWKQCDGQVDDTTIAARLADVYDVPLNAAWQHVERTLEELNARRLVSVREA